MANTVQLIRYTRRHVTASRDGRAVFYLRWVSFTESLDDLTVPETLFQGFINQ